MTDGLYNLILLVPVFLFSLCVHEFAHAWVAVRRGDTTPAAQGRLTLHPMAHADPMGTLILPALCIYFSLPFFGWAKPVPVDIRNLRYGRRDMALVAAAGPGSNFLLAVLAAGLLAVLARVPWEGQYVEAMASLSKAAIYVNLMLAFFNLIPLPPLDGFMILQGFLPTRWLTPFQRLSGYTDLVLLLLLVSGGLSVVGIPVLRCYRLLLELSLG